MVGETEMNQHNGSKSGSEGSAVAQVGRLIRRILDLTELQGELFKIDAREGGKALAIPAILIATGIVLGFGGILVLLLALAEGLQRIGLSEAASFLGAGFFGLILAAGAIWSGWYFLRKAVAAFDRSKTELQRNIAWFRATVTHPSSEHRVHNTNQNQD